MTQKWRARARLSGGQKQRFLLPEPFKGRTYFALDEPTSAVDVETGKEIQVALREISHNRTVITSCTQTEHYCGCPDEIYVFENGKL